MKKDKKEIKETLEPQPIIYRFTPDQMIFSINGKEVFLPRAGAFFLFGRNVEIEFEKANNEDKDFSMFEELEAFSLFIFYSQRRNMNVRDIAKKLNFPVEKYVRWISQSATRITTLLKTRSREIDTRIEELEKEYPLSEPEKEEKFWPDAAGKIGKKVAEMLLEDKNPRIIAQELKVDYGKFYRWFLNKGTQRHVLRIRNEIAERDAARNE